jgi:hypothetical protein
MKNFFTITVPVFIVCFVVADYFAHQKYPNINLLELTGKKETTNKMAYWTNQDAFCGYEPKPGNYSGNKTVNKYGFVSTPDINLEKAPDVKRIVGGLQLPAPELICLITKHTHGRWIPC